MLAVVGGQPVAAADNVGSEMQEAAIGVAESRPTSGDAGETFATAADLGVVQGTRVARGSVGPWDRLDVVRFSVARESRVDLRLQALTGDVDLYVYDARGSLLGRSTHFGLAPEAVAGTLPAGEYYLAVAPVGWWGGSYQLSLQADAVVTEPIAVPNDAPVRAFPDVAYFGGSNEWNLNSINAPEVWNQGFTGQGVTVAVVDTGVDLSHPDLVSSLWVNPGEIAGNGRDDDGNGWVDDVQGWDFADGDATPTDGNGHGTHVAGTIAAALNGFGATGVAPNATIMPVRVLGDDGSGTTAAVAAGIRYAAESGADIINLSLGGGLSNAIRAAIEYAGQLGSLVVAAAGNEGAPTPGYPARFSSALSHVISVGAFSSSGVVAGFSNDVGWSDSVQVDAPGVGIFSTYTGRGFAQLNGTSMAAPHVSGVAALALSARPGLTPAQLRAVIVEGANRSIRGSDSQGAINAAMTVALAAAGRTADAGETRPAVAQTGNARYVWSSGGLLFRRSPALVDVALRHWALDDRLDGRVRVPAGQASQIGCKTVAGPSRYSLSAAPAVFAAYDAADFQLEHARELPQWTDALLEDVSAGIDQLDRPHP